MATQLIYQFYSALKDYEPKIWRRFQVAGNVTMARLGYIVMTMYEMQASHMFSINYSLVENQLPYLSGDNGDTEKIRPLFDSEHTVHHYEIESEDSLPSTHDEKMHDATGTTLRQLASRPGLRLSMQYDYGEGWEIELILEDIISDELLDGNLLPRVLEGDGFGIIEGCGGPDGLTRLAKTFMEKTGPEYRAFSERMGREDFNLACFNIDDMNFRLKKVPRIYRDIYERGFPPTKQSLDILNREYLK